MDCGFFGPCIQIDIDRRVYNLLRICVILCTFIYCAWETDLSFPGCFSWWTDLGCAQLYYYYQVGIWRYCSGLVLKTFERVFMWQYFPCKIVPNCSENTFKSIGDITIVPAVNHTHSWKNIVSSIVYIIYLSIERGVFSQCLPPYIWCFVFSVCIHSEGIFLRLFLMMLSMCFHIRYSNHIFLSLSHRRFIWFFFCVQILHLRSSHCFPEFVLIFVAIKSYHWSFVEFQRTLKCCL